MIDLKRPVGEIVAVTDHVEQLGDEFDLFGVSFLGHRIHGSASTRWLKIRTTNPRDVP
jgi:hypothetical protein